VSKKPLPVLQTDIERTAVVAALPDDVAAIPSAERAGRVRTGTDTVLLDVFTDGVRATRGFVRVVLTVPLGHPGGSVYSIFVEVDRPAYATLQNAFRTHASAEVTATLANRLRHLEDAYGSTVVVREEGGDRVEHALLRDGPSVGTR
jgi:hypothetical protein